MKIGIMQPYFLPYIGYFQLIKHVDQMVIYDNIEYTKKGWINRNRMLLNGEATFFTIPLQKDSDFLNVNSRIISIEWTSQREKLLNKIKNNYSKAPFFLETYPFLEYLIQFEERNLFLFILNSIKLINQLLGITTSLDISSNIPIDHTLKSEEKVIALCKQLKANEYINPVGGKSIYSHTEFENQGVKLSFINTSYFEYKQLNNTFVSHLSILDVLMFNSIQNIKENLLQQYEIIR